MYTVIPFLHLFSSKQIELTSSELDSAENFDPAIKTVKLFLHLNGHYFNILEKMKISLK